MARYVIDVNHLDYDELSSLSSPPDEVNSCLTSYAIISPTHMLSTAFN